MNILADASLLGLTDFFAKPFKLSFFQHPKDIVHLLQNIEILLCRSTLKVNRALLHTHQPRCIATASSGIDHIDMDFLRKENIHLLDAKGSNAHSVADYVLSCIAYIEQYHSMNGRRLGIIGYGAVGKEVATRLKRFQFEIVVYDPPKALQEKNFKSTSLQEILAADIICIHASLHDNPPHPSRHLIQAPELLQLRPNTLLINASRGDIVSEEALLDIKPPIMYCTDVYANEPEINPSLVAFARLCTPHIAGHSLEAKRKALCMLSEKLHQHYELPWPEKERFDQETTQTAKAMQTMPIISSNASWQELALSLYNPIFETIQLKEARNKGAAFLSMRKEHCKRHDFKF